MTRVFGEEGTYFETRLETSNTTSEKGIVLISASEVVGHKSHVNNIHPRSPVENRRFRDKGAEFAGERGQRVAQPALAGACGSTPGAKTDAAAKRAAQLQLAKSGIT